VHARRGRCKGNILPPASAGVIGSSPHVRALIFDTFGGPEVLSYGELPTPELLPGTALVRTRAIGLNFADVYRRRGTYHLSGSPPYVLGYEAAGEIVASSEDGGAGGATPRFEIGQRVAFADVPHANAEIVRAPLSHLVPLPATLSFELAAAVMLQGLTAQYLVEDSFVVRPGQLALVHAAAGGVGMLLTQLLKLAGATVVALASTDAKCAHARRLGADVCLRYDQDWVSLAKRAAPDGQGADVVYDSVGSTLEQSLEAARKGGAVVFYGMAGGDPAFVDPRRLMDQSKALIGGDLWNVLTSSSERVRRAGALFAQVAAGKVQVTIAARIPLSRGAEAHSQLEGRGVAGKIILVPDGWIE
jgi:NADPH:quinone reductase